MDRTSSLHFRLHIQGTVIRIKVIVLRVLVRLQQPLPTGRDVFVSHVTNIGVETTLVGQLLRNPGHLSLTRKPVAAFDYVICITAMEQYLVFAARVP